MNHLSVRTRFRLSVAVVWAALAGAAVPVSQAASIIGLGDLPNGSFNSIAFGVSGDGSTVVGRGSGASGFEAFRWTSGGGMVGLGDLPDGSFGSRAYGVSGDGSTVVGFGNSASGIEAFRWTSGGGMVGLGDLPDGSFESRAYGVSGDGSTVVGFGVSASGQEAFVWTPDEGMLSLSALLSASGVDVSGWSALTEARGISADGRYVVGFGTSSLGTEAFLVDLAGTTAFSEVPEPSTYAAGLAVLGAVGSVWWRNRRRA